MTLVVLGDLMVDVIVQVSGPPARGGDTPTRISVSGGGSAANVAAWAAALGTRVALVCNVGDDDRGRTAVAELEGVEVHARVDRERPTGTCVVLVEPDGERTMHSDPGANDAPLAEIPLGDHLHVAGYALLRDGPRASALAAIERARTAGMTVSIDPSPFVRPGAFPTVDLLLPNEREAEGLHGEMAVKLGARGARWGDIHVPAVPAEVVDTTGAGDAFAAGLLTARLNGAVRRDALEAACAAAARAVGQTGARPR